MAPSYPLAVVRFAAALRQFASVHGFEYPDEAAVISCFNILTDGTVELPAPEPMSAPATVPPPGRKQGRGVVAASHITLAVLERVTGGELLTANDIVDRAYLLYADALGTLKPISLLTVLSKLERQGKVEVAGMTEKTMFGRQKKLWRIAAPQGA